MGQLDCSEGSDMSNSYKPIYRIHIKPGDKSNPTASFDYCKEQKVIGMGWPVEAGSSSLSWKEYESRAVEQYRKAMAPVKYFYKNVKETDLIWTRNPAGRYYLVRIKGPWEYRESPREIDIWNVMACDMKEIENIDEVPGKVIASFRATRTIQAIRNHNVSIYSRYLWNKIARKEIYALEPLQSEDIFTFLDDKETEDVVFLYLQKKCNWLVVPSSRRKDTMKYEFLLIKPDGSCRAVVQVKTGNTPVGDPSWYEWKEKVFLFQSKEKYNIESSENVECLRKDDLLDFMQENMKILPQSISLWFDILRECNTAASQ